MIWEKKSEICWRSFDNEIHQRRPLWTALHICADRSYDQRKIIWKVHKQRSIKIADNKICQKSCFLFWYLLRRDTSVLDALCITYTKTYYCFFCNNTFVLPHYTHHKCNWAIYQEKKSLYFATVECIFFSFRTAMKGNALLAWNRVFSYAFLTQQFFYWMKRKQIVSYYLGAQHKSQ